MAAPDWRKIFKEHPELNPPGYEETAAQMQAAGPRSKKKAKSKSKRSRSISIKHTNPDP